MMTTIYLGWKAYRIMNMVGAFGDDDLVTGAVNAVRDNNEYVIDLLGLL